MLELAKRGAVLRLRELANEVELLLNLFPDLGDAFDADELPVSFIVRTDARRPAAQAAGGKKPAASNALRRQAKQGWAERRAGARERT
jgi:hypothetical protein